MRLKKKGVFVWLPLQENKLHDILFNQVSPDTTNQKLSTFEILAKDTHLQKQVLEKEQLVRKNTSLPVFSRTDPLLDVSKQPSSYLRESLIIIQAILHTLETGGLNPKEAHQFLTLTDKTGLAHSFHKLKSKSFTAHVM